VQMVPLAAVVLE